jgi:hypothetical protein
MDCTVAVTAVDDPTGEIRTAPAAVVLERDVRVQARPADRLRAQPDLSVREAKRILCRPQVIAAV